MSKKKLKKEVKRLNKIIDVLLKENRGVFFTAVIPSEKEMFEELSKGLDDKKSSVTTTNDYIGGRPDDRK